MILKEKLTYLKTHQLSFNTDIIQFFSQSDSILSEITRAYQQFNELLEIGKLNSTEFDTLKYSINQFKKNFEKLEPLINHNKDKIDFLKQIRENAINIIEEFKIVKELETWRWGDYVLDVKRDTLCSINSEKLEAFLDTLEKVSSYIEKNETQEELPNTCNLFRNIANYFGMFENEFILNVVYRRPTEIMSKISEIVLELDKIYLFFRRTIAEKFFKATTENCLTNIQRLEEKYLPPGKQLNKWDTMVKLKDIVGPKKKALCLYEFRDVCKYAFKF